MISNKKLIFYDKKNKSFPPKMFQPKKNLSSQEAEINYQNTKTSLRNFIFLAAAIRAIPFLIQ
jgi:hypothetical protein